MKKLPIKITFWKIVAALIFLLGIYALGMRFIKGLGATTNLSDVFPWGLWIGFDVLVGVGLAAGGFTVAAIVHIFHIEKYEPISRPSLLTAFLGYLLVGAAIFIDIGQPHRIWHPLVMWNPHSVMFEVSWCVMLYTTVLALEFSPLVFEKFNLHVPLKLVRTIYLPLVIAGVLLSTLHQSSLGTVYVIVPDKLHGLWYTPMLPVFFFISAIAAGLAMTIFESFLSFRAFGKRLELDILEGLGRVIVLILGVYFVLKIQDLNQRGNLGLVFELTPESVMFWGELGLGVALPMVLLLFTKIRTERTGLFFSALLVIMGFILNRLNVSITGMLHSEMYIPKWTEIAVTAFMVTAGFTAFALGVKYFHIFPEEEIQLDENKPRYLPGLSPRVILGMWVVVLSGMIIYGIAQKGQHDVHAAPLTEIERRADPIEDQELDQLPADFEIPSSEDSPAPVIFSHETHQMFMEEVTCQPCHPGLYSYGQGEQDMVRTEAVIHSEESCGYCHNGEAAFGIEDGCDMCHYE